MDVVGLVVDTAEILTRLYQYGRAVKESSKAIARLIGAFAGLQGILEQIDRLRKRELEDDSELEALVSSRAFNDALVETRALLDNLLYKLEPPQKTRQKILRALAWPYTEKNVNEQLAFLEKVKTMLTLSLVGDIAGINSVTLSELRDLDRFVREDHEDRTIQKEKDRQYKIRNELQCSDPSVIHTQMCRVWQDNTKSGAWFINTQFRPWLEDADEKQSHRIMWLKARSGAGKSTLFSHCVETVRQTVYKANPFRENGLAFFYTTFNDETSRTAQNALVTLVYQLALYQPDILRHFSNPTSDDVDSQKMQDTRLLCEAITEAANASDRVVLMLDAINEGNEVDSLLACLRSILNQTSSVKVFLTSTLEVESYPLRNMEQCKEILLRPEDTEGDIDDYIQTKLKTGKVYQAMKKEKQDDIVKALTNRADGM